jgi:hypothetical protein
VQSQLQQPLLPVLLGLQHKAGALQLARVLAGHLQQVQLHLQVQQQQ